MEVKINNGEKKIFAILSSKRLVVSFPLGLCHNNALVQDKTWFSERCMDARFKARVALREYSVAQ